MAGSRFELRAMRPADMVLCGAELARAVRGASSLEDAAGNLVRGLRESLWDGAADRSAVVLARFYRTINHADLEPALREFATATAPGAVGPGTKCLTLLGTAGDLPPWNSRFESRGHRAIPLSSRAAVERLPMVARLISELGMSVEALTGEAGDVTGAATADMGTGNLFHVRRAPGSRYIPEQESFVRAHGVESVVGFGGPLTSGDLWAVVLFTRVPVERPLADLFRFLATDVKIAMLPLLSRRFFAA